MLFKRRRDYFQERRFMKESFVRLRGKNWFLACYALFKLLEITLFITIVGIVVSLIVYSFSLLGTSLQKFQQVGVWQFDSVSWQSQAWQLLFPNNWLIVIGQLNFVIQVILGIIWCVLVWKKVINRVYQWYQEYSDKTREGDRFADIQEIDASYKLIPNRNKFYKGSAGQPVAHINGYSLDFAMLHPLLWLKQWLKRPLGMNSLVFSGIYKRIRPILMAHLPQLFERQLTVTGGFDAFYWIDTSNTHSKTLGLTRSTKDQMRGYPLIDIIRRAERQWNIVDTDAKNEDAKKSYVALRQAGYDVRLLNIMEPSESESWNPLAVAVDYAFEGDWDNANTELRKVVQVIGGSDGGNNGSKDIWDSAAESTIQAVMLAILAIAVSKKQPSLCTLPNVVKFINDMNNEYSDETGDGLTKYFQLIAQLPKTPINTMMLMNAGQYLGATGDTKTSILFTVLDRLNIFASESVSRLTTLNTIHLTDLGFPRMLKLHFGKAYAGQHLSIKVTGKGINQTETEKLTISQVGTLSYPIKMVLPKDWTITLSFDNKGNDMVIKQQRFLLTGQKIDVIGLDGQPKIDPYSKRVQQKVVMNPIVAIHATHLPEVTLRYTENPIAVFVITPQSNDDFSALASLFISQAYAVNTDIASRITRRKMDNWILYKLNEFSMYPRIPGFNNMLTRGLTYGHLVDLYVQTLSQPRLHYSEMETEEINGNTGNWFHILTNDDATNEVLSKKLGEVEVQTETVSSQIGLERQDKGSRQIQIKTMPLLSPKEISELSEHEMITIRTIKRKDRKGRSVRPLPIFASGKFALPFAYTFLGDQYTLDYYTADLNIKAVHNRFAYDDLYHDFTPYYQEALEAAQLAGLVPLNDSGHGSMKTKDLTEEAIMSVAEAFKPETPALSKETIDDETAFVQWQDSFDLAAPLLSPAQLANPGIRDQVEGAIYRVIPKVGNNTTPLQTSALPLLKRRDYLSRHTTNNLNRTVLDLLNGDVQLLWEIVKQIPEPDDETTTDEAIVEQEEMENTDE